MRIDVTLAHRDVDAELAKLYWRLRTPGDAMHGLPTIHGPVPGMLLHVREHAGELCVYLEDVQAGAMAGCTVFHRPFEPEARRLKFLRSPHSRYGSAYQRRGLATAVYTWALQSGLCLLSGPRQSPAAHRLWLSLGQTHRLLVAQLNDRQLRHPGSVEPAAFERLDTRLLLLGSGWTPERFARRADFASAPEGAAQPCWRESARFHSCDGAARIGEPAGP